MKRALKVIGALVVLSAVFVLGWLLAVTGAGQAADPQSLSERERAFTDRMQNVVLIGNFTSWPVH